MGKTAGHGNGSKPITMNFSGMNIYLLAILRFTRYQGFDSVHGPSAYQQVERS